MWPYPKIVAHRGGGTLAPENTLAGMRAGLAHGFRAVEFDVMLSKDGVPVVMHDPHLGRTVAGSGNVFDYTAGELETMDAGSWLRAEFAGEPVPAYRDVVQFCRANDIWMNVEIKPAPGYAELTGRTVASLTAQWFAQELADYVPGMNDDILPLFSSFSLDALIAARQSEPRIPRGFLVDRLTDDWQEKLSPLQAVAVHTDHRHLTPALAQQVKQAGYGLFCYTVNDPARARELLGWGVDALCTDRIDLIGPDFG